MSKYGVFSGQYFPAFGLNTERYEVSLRIQSECGKIRTRKNSVFGHISHSARRLKILFFNKYWLLHKMQLARRFSQGKLYENRIVIALGMWFESEKMFLHNIILSSLMLFSFQTTYFIAFCDFSYYSSMHIISSQLAKYRIIVKFSFQSKCAMGDH